MSYVKDIAMGSKPKMTVEQKKKSTDLIEKQRKEDSKLVTGMFKNLECAGGDVTFAVGLYKGDPIRQYHLIDGQTYEIPLGVAKHINNQCVYRKKRYKDILTKSASGRWETMQDKPVERYKFISTDFM